MASIHASVFILIAFSLITRVFGDTCYYPDGSSDSSHYACTSGGTSVCCAEGFECLSNGLCNDYRYDNFERVLRGGCTDKNWGDGCPQKCTSIWPQGDEIVYVCNNGKFCCGTSNDCCNDDDAALFEFGSPKVVAIAGKTQADPTSISEDADDSESTSKTGQQTKTSSTYATGSIQAATQQTQRSSTTSESTQDLTTAGPSSNPSNSNNVSNTEVSPASTNNTVAIAVGIGVSIGVIVVLLIIAGCWYIRHKRRGHSLGREKIYEIGASGTPPIELAGDGVSEKSKHWLHGRTFELDGGVKGVEMPVGNKVQEVSGESIQEKNKSEGRKWPDEYP